MKVFISWSGEPSLSIALVFRSWLPLVFRGLRPFVSAADIDKGGRWATELDRQLEGTDFGLICLTPVNLTAPWLMYEAGALAKSVEIGRVATVLHDVAPADVTYPLARFQATKLKKDDVFQLVDSMNRWPADEAYSEQELVRVFELMWPELDHGIREATNGQVASAEAPETVRADREILEELLASVRRMTAALEASPPLEAADREGGEAPRSAPILRRSWPADEADERAPDDAEGQ